MAFYLPFGGAVEHAGSGQYFLSLFFYKQPQILLGKTDATHWKSVYVKHCFTSDKNNDGILQYTEETSSQAQSTAIMANVYNNNAE